jgi:uncharacterized protein YjbJ (UPF0337 family)
MSTRFLVSLPQGDFPMSGTKDKAKGLANEAVGNIKQGVGKVTGNERLKGEGKAQEVKGEVQQKVGEVKDAVKKP